MLDTQEVLNKLVLFLFSTTKTETTHQKIIQASTVISALRWLRQEDHEFEA
jgi:hypothetical protein